MSNWFENIVQKNSRKVRESTNSNNLSKIGNIQQRMKTSVCVLKWGQVPLNLLIFLQKFFAYNHEKNINIV